MLTLETVAFATPQHDRGRKGKIDLRTPSLDHHVTYISQVLDTKHSASNSVCPLWLL